MSHLLASVNPAAAAAIRPAAGKRALPGVGETVVYHTREGWGREGRTRFPAIVFDHGPNDTLSLVVIFDAGDFQDNVQIEEIGIGKQFHVWERVEPVRPFDERMAQPAGLAGELKSLESAVFGDFDRPSISIIDILQDFEQRLAKLQAKSGKGK